MTMGTGTASPGRLAVHALTFGGEDCASTRFRIIQFARILSEKKIDLTWSQAGDGWPEDLAGKDVVILQKKPLKRRIWKKLRGVAKKIVYDIDDAIWLPLTGRHHFLTEWRIKNRLGAIVRESDLCLAANSHLASYLSALGASRIRVLPMALDEGIWTGRGGAGLPPVMGWSGAPHNLVYLEGIAPVLKRCLERPGRERAGLCVFSGRRPVLDFPFEYVPYADGGEVEVMKRMGIGLLPLEKSGFAHGKSPIKALQYLSAGLPVVAAPLEGTRELFGREGLCDYADTPEEWETALSRLLDDPEERAGRSALCRGYFEEELSLGVRAEELADLLFRTAGRA